MLGCVWLDEGRKGEGCRNVDSEADCMGRCAVNELVGVEILKINVELI